MDRKILIDLLDDFAFGSHDIEQTVDRITELYKQTQALQLQQTDVSGSYKPLTLSMIDDIVDETKDLTQDEQTAVAYSMPMTACGLYVLKMKSKYGISIAI